MSGRAEADLLLTHFQGGERLPLLPVPQSHIHKRHQGKNTLPCTSCLIFFGVLECCAWMSRFLSGDFHFVWGKVFSTVSTTEVDAGQTGGRFFSFQVWRGPDLFTCLKVDQQPTCVCRHCVLDVERVQCTQANCEMDCYQNNSNCIHFWNWVSFNCLVASMYLHSFRRQSATLGKSGRSGGLFQNKSLSKLSFMRQLLVRTLFLDQMCEMVHSYIMISLQINSEIIILYYYNYTVIWMKYVEQYRKRPYYCCGTFC